jgi:hypothetical protein
VDIEDNHTEAQFNTKPVTTKIVMKWAEALKGTFEVVVTEGKDILFPVPIAKPPKPVEEKFDSAKVLKRAIKQLVKQVKDNTFSITEINDLLTVEKVRKNRKSLINVFEEALLDDWDFTALKGKSVKETKELLKTFGYPNFVLKQVLKNEKRHLKRVSLIYHIEQLINRGRA